MKTMKTNQTTYSIEEKESDNYPDQAIQGSVAPISSQPLLDHTTVINIEAPEEKESDTTQPLLSRNQRLDISILPNPVLPSGEFELPIIGEICTNPNANLSGVTEKLMWHSSHGTVGMIKFPKGDGAGGRQEVYSETVTARIIATVFSGLRSYYPEAPIDNVLAPDCFATSVTKKIRTRRGGLFSKSQPNTTTVTAPVYVSTFADMTQCDLRTYGNCETWNESVYKPFGEGNVTPPNIGMGYGILSAYAFLFADTDVIGKDAQNKGWIEIGNQVYPFIFDWVLQTELTGKWKKGFQYCNKRSSNFYSKLSKSLISPLSDNDTSIDASVLFEIDPNHLSVKGRLPRQFAHSRSETISSGFRSMCVRNDGLMHDDTYLNKILGFVLLLEHYKDIQQILAEYETIIEQRRDPINGRLNTEQLLHLNEMTAFLDAAKQRLGARMNILFRHPDIAKMMDTVKSINDMVDHAHGDQSPGINAVAALYNLRKLFSPKKDMVAFAPHSGPYRVIQSLGDADFFNLTIDLERSNETAIYFNSDEALPPEAIAFLEEKGLIENYGDNTFSIQTDNIPLVNDLLVREYFYPQTLPLSEITPLGDSLLKFITANEKTLRENSRFMQCTNFQNTGIHGNGGGHLDTLDAIINELNRLNTEIDATKQTHDPMLMNTLMSYKQCLIREAQNTILKLHPNSSQKVLNFFARTHASDTQELALNQFQKYLHGKITRAELRKTIDEINGLFRGKTGTKLAYGGDAELRAKISVMAHTQPVLNYLEKCRQALPKNNEMTTHRRSKLSLLLRHMRKQIKKQGRLSPLQLKLYFVSAHEIIRMRADFNTNNNSSTFNNHSKLKEYMQEFNQSMPQYKLEAFMESIQTHLRNPETNFIIELTEYIERLGDQHREQAEYDDDDFHTLCEHGRLNYEDFTTPTHEELNLEFQDFRTRAEASLQHSTTRATEMQTHTRQTDTTQSFGGDDRRAPNFL